MENEIFIKRIFIFTLFLCIASLLLGIVLDIKLLYISFSMGVLVSFISNALLYISIYFTIKNRDRKIILIRFMISYLLYAVSLYISYMFIKTEASVIVTGLGFLSFKTINYILYIIYNIKKRGV